MTHYINSWSSVSHMVKHLGRQDATLKRAIEQMSNWSAAAISNYSHKDLPWEVTEEGKEISYELAFYREAPYSVRNYGDEIERA